MILIWSARIIKFWGMIIIRDPLAVIIQGKTRSDRAIFLGRRI